VSRRPKLDTIPADWLLLVAREWASGDYNDNQSAAHVTKVLESAASRGNEEAGWLLAVMTRNGPIPNVTAHSHDYSEWLAKIMTAEEGPRAQYYRGRELARLPEPQIHDDVDALLLCSAESGFAPAMAELIYSRFDESGMKWLKMAAERNDPYGLFRLGELAAAGETSRRFQLWEAAAKLGHALSMSRLTHFFLGVAGLDWAILRARYILLTADQHSMDGLDHVFYHENADVQLMFVVGRELEGYDQFWDEGRRLEAHFERCIDLFLTVSHRARLAALQTMAMLRRHHGFPRDVAMLIARRVYQTRDDASVWLEPLQPKAKNKA